MPNLLAGWRALYACDKPPQGEGTRRPPGDGIPTVAGLGNDAKDCWCGPALNVAPPPANIAQNDEGLTGRWIQVPAQAGTQQETMGWAGPERSEAKRSGVPREGVPSSAQNPDAVNPSRLLITHFLWIRGCKKGQNPGFVCRQYTQNAYKAVFMDWRH